MKDVTFKRKYMATLLVCIVFIMIVGNHSGAQPNKWTDIGDVVVNEISVNGKLKFDKNCDGKADMTLTCKNVKLMPVNYPDSKKHAAYALGRYRAKCAKFFINSKNEIIKWEAYPDRKICCPGPISKCDMCPLDTSSWAGLSNTYNGSSPPYPADINVSSTPGNISATSGSIRDIAVDATGRIHAVWIEIENDVRNVYYACSQPSGTWAKTNVSRFPTKGKKFQARNAALAVTPRGVPHIAWEVEIDNNKTPLTLEHDDDHYVYYVYGSSGCPQSGWKTCAGTIYSPPLPSHTPGPNSYNDANVSRNDSNSSHADAWNPAIALDNKGRPHITWHNETPYHTIFWIYCDEGQWKTCDGAVYHFQDNSNCNAIVSQTNSSHYLAPSIAIDSKNNVHIAYHSHNFQTSASSIYYVRIINGTTGYDCQQPIDTGNSGKYASIAVDSNNYPHIVWEDDGIKYSHFSGTNWSSPVDISNTQDCHQPCLALDRDDNTHIVFYCKSNNNYEIFYSFNNNNLSISTPPVNVSSNKGNSFSPSLALDNNCNPHLLWTDETPEAEREVLYVHLQCCKWTNCGIIKSKKINGLNPVKIEFYDCETGKTITIYGQPNLFAVNADDIDWSPSNSGTIAKYEEGLCAKYCLLKNKDGSLQIDKWEAVSPDDPCCCGGEKICPCVENASPAPYCLLSNFDMQVLTGGDFSSPANAVWDQVNAIACTEADKSAWGQGCTDLPWKYLYRHGACWVYGNRDWQSPGNTVEYYKLEFKLEECSKLMFEAFIDDCAAFYIDGTGAAIYDSCEAVFQCAKHTFTSYCLEPGTHTLYIKHRDTRKHIYGLIFAAKCIPCECCCRELCGCFKKEATGFLFYENCDFKNEPIVIGTGGNRPDIYEEFQSLEDYFKRYPAQRGWCARICVIDEAGKVSLQWWQALANEKPPACCGDTCCDYELKISKIPSQLCPGESWKVTYTIKNNCPRGDYIEFKYSALGDGSVAVPPGSFTVPGGGGTKVSTVTYTMPGQPGAPCAIRSHTFKWALVTVGRNCPPTRIENKIHCKPCKK